MHADLKGALAQINRSYRAFTHKGESMTKMQVKKVLEYGISKGYDHTGQLTEPEIDSIINNLK